MGKLTMTRRSFTELAAVVGTAAAFGVGANPARALAESAQQEDGGQGVKKIRSCCRGCGKVECGVWVYVQDGKVIRTEGDESCFNTMGNHCSKGQASIQAAYHPDRIKYPMKRTNPKGDDDPGWVRISWDEAYQAIADNIMQIREKYGAESLFTWCGTGRQWCMQSDAGMALELFGTPNIVAAYQVCKGPRHFSSRLDNVQAYSWSEVINHSTKYVQWATDPSVSNYDDSSRLVTDVARQADAFIVVDPRMTNLGRTAKYWLNLRPGTDNAMALGWCHIILEHDLVDWQFVKRWSNAPFVVVPDMEPTGYTEAVQNTKGPYAYRTRLLTEADIDPSMVDWEVEGEGNPKRYLVFDQINKRWTYWQADPEDAHWEGEAWKKQTSGFTQDVSRLHDDESKVAGWIADLSEFDPLIDPALYGEFEVKLKDGSTHKGRPAWDLWAEYLQEFLHACQRSRAWMRSSSRTRWWNGQRETIRAFPTAASTTAWAWSMRATRRKIAAPSWRLARWWALSTRPAASAVPRTVGPNNPVRAPCCRRWARSRSCHRPNCPLRWPAMRRCLFSIGTACGAMQTPPWSAPTRNPMPPTRFMAA